jgi:hypothetical protein
LNLGEILRIGINYAFINPKNILKGGEQERTGGFINKVRVKIN